MRPTPPAVERPLRRFEQAHRYRPKKTVEHNPAISCTDSYIRVLRRKESEKDTERRMEMDALCDCLNITIGLTIYP